MKRFFRITIKEKNGGGIKSETFFTDKHIAERFQVAMEFMLKNMGADVDYEAHFLDAYENDAEVLMMVEHTIKEAARQATIKAVLLNHSKN